MSYKDKTTWKVYIHTTPSGKSYIGITSRKVNKRWGTNGQYYVGSPYFYRAIQKYGWDNIKHDILEDNLSFDEAINKEKYYIEFYKSNNPQYGYNLTKGGEGAYGYKMPDEKRKLLSCNRQGINSVGYNHFPSKETKIKMSNSNKNKQFSDDTRKKMSIEKCKEVYQYNLDGVFI
jgi:group I intron endonuclease